MKHVGRSSAFFHTLVVMGGSLAGCGGHAQDGTKRPSGDGDGDAAGSGGTGSGSQTGDGDGGGLVGSGGLVGVGTGGRVGDGDGDIIIGSGGSSAAGGNYMGGAHGLGCPPEQWACSNVSYDCSWDAYEILTNCSCDLSKPTRPEDCPAGTALTCMEGFEYDPDRNEAHTQAFSCACVEQQETCREQCQPFDVSYSDCWEPSDDFQGYLCGCEIPVLR